LGQSCLESAVEHRLLSTSLASLTWAVSTFLAPDLQTLLTDSKSADFAIVMDDSTRIPVHKELLRWRWPWFHNLLEVGLKEAQDGTRAFTWVCIDTPISLNWLGCVHFKHDTISSKAMRGFLSYLYCGALDASLPREELQKLVVLLDYTNFLDSPLAYVVHQHLVKQINAQ